MNRYTVLGLVAVGLLALAGWLYLDAPQTALLALVLTQPMAFLALALPGVRLARLAGPNVDAKDGFGAVCISVLLFKLLPSRLSEGAKPLVLYLAAECPLPTGIAAIAFERFLDLACVAILVAIAIAANSSDSDNLLPDFSLLAAIVLMGAAGIIFLIKAPSLFDRIVAFLPFKMARRVARSLIDAVRDIAARSDIWPIIGLSGATWLSAFVVFVIYFEVAGGIDLTMGQVLAVYVFSTLGLAVAIAPGGLGTYEAAIVAGLTVYGYPFDEALLTALILRVANMAPAVPGTIWYLSRQKLELADILSRLKNRGSRGET